MALRTPPSYLQNGSHPAEQDRLTTQGLFRTSGVLLASDLQVTQSSVAAMSVQIAAGWGNIIGTTQSNMGAYQFYNDAAATATITTADLTNPRIDLICITVRDAYYTGANNDVIINVVAGTPAGSPAVPATPANSLVLAQVAVAALATTIVNANITDLRQVVAPVNVAQSVAGKNAIINGGMDIWQRGTSIALAASAGVTYLADRWCTATGANQASTVSRQVTGDTTNLPNIQYCLRYQRNAGQTGVGTYSLIQNLETINSIPFAGKQITISGYIRAGANFSATSNLMTLVLILGTGTDQSLISGFTGQTTVATANATLTTTWQRFSVTGTVGATATQLGLGAVYIPTGTAGANDYFEITGVQVELGSTATTFSRAGGSIGGELALCQRYYYRVPATTSAYAGLGTAYSTTAAAIQLPLKATMRAVPTVIDFSSPSLADVANAAINATTVTIGGSTSADLAEVLVTGAVGLTQYRPYYLAGSTGSGYVGVGAEL